LKRKSPFQDGAALLCHRIINGKINEKSPKKLLQKSSHIRLSHVDGIFALSILPFISVVNKNAMAKQHKRTQQSP